MLLDPGVLVGAPEQGRYRSSWGQGKNEADFPGENQEHHFGYPKCRAPISCIPVGRPAQGFGGGKGRPRGRPADSSRADSSRAAGADRAGPAPPPPPPLGRPTHLERLAQLQVESDHAHALQPGREARPGRRRSPRSGGRRAQAAASPARPGAGQRVHGCRDCTRRALPGEPFRGVAGGTARRRRPRHRKGPRRRAVERPPQTRGARRGLRAPGGRRSAVRRSGAQLTREKGPLGPERPEPGGGTSGEGGGCAAGDPGKSGQTGVGDSGGAALRSGETRAGCGLEAGGSVCCRLSQPECIVADTLLAVRHGFQPNWNIA